MQSFDLNGIWILVLDYHTVPDSAKPGGAAQQGGTPAFTTAWSVDEEWSTTGPFMQFASHSLADDFLRQHQKEMENAYLSF